jgi:uroporphyrinogen decarboxylase
MIMSMNSREIILANIGHANPDRPGLTFDQGRANDMVWGRFTPPVGYTAKRWVEGDREFYDDQWGNIWMRMLEGSLQGEVYKPAIGDWSDLTTYQPPQYNVEDCVAAIGKSFADRPETKDKFRIISMPWVYASSRYLRKMEVYLEDLALQPEELHRLHAVVAGVCETLIHAAGKAGADGITFAEDMGTQIGLLFSPTMWREYFGDLYKRLFGLAHEYGMKVLMHSCGRNWQILPGLLDAGVDCFQFDQPTLYDMPALATMLRLHKAALWSPIDIQKILPTGDREKIEDGARCMYETFKGGLIFGNYGDLQGIGVKPEWNDWGYQEILRLCHLAK